MKIKPYFAIALMDVITGTGLLSAPASAQVDPSEITIPYSSSGSQTIGDAVNIEFPSSALGRCVEYQDGDVKWDTNGAIASDGIIDIISNYSKQRQEGDLDLGYKTTAKVAAGVFNANSTTEASYKTTKVRDDEDRSVTIEFHSYADYGRRMIQNYKVKPGSPSPAPDLPAYRSMCGTHFIRGQQRFSELAILVEIKTSTKSGKDALTAALNQTIGGGVSLKAVSASGTAFLNANYKSIIDFAQSSGNVHVEYRAQGGPGIKAAGESSKIVDPTDIVKLSQIASNVSSLFDQNNSSITGYVLQSDTALGAPSYTFDADRVRRIGSLTRVLIKVNDAASRYTELKAKNPNAYNKYFAAQDSALSALKASLVDKIKICASGAACTNLTGDVLENYSFLEDMLQNPVVSISCQYQPAKDLLSAGAGASNNPKLLESISVNVIASVEHYDLIDFTSLKVERLDPAFQASDVTSGFSGFAFSSPRGNSRRANGTIFSANIRPAEVLKYDPATNRYSTDQIEFMRRREQILGSVFSLSAVGPSGYKVSYETGYPPRQDCPLIE